MSDPAVFGRLLVEPSYSRTPTWQGSDLDLAEHRFPCASCKADVSVGIRSLVAAAWNWERELGTELSEAAAAFFDLGVVRKSKDGGWPAMVRVSCRACKAAYLVYSGVTETSNSVYAVTVQAVVELSA